MATPPAGKSDPDGGTNAAHNLWDAVVAAIVVGALVGLVVYLVHHYGDHTEKIAAVLGVAAPVLAAAFGVSIGYYSGNKAGQSTGKERARKEISSRLQPIVDTLDTHLEQGILTPVTTDLASEPGEPTFKPAAGAGPTIQHEDLSRTRDAVALLKGIIASS